MLHRMMNNKNEQKKSSGSCLGRMEAGVDEQRSTLEMKATHHNGPDAYTGSYLSNRKQSAPEILLLQ